MLSYEQAIHIVLDSLPPLPPAQIPLDQAVGKVLAGPVVARWPLPAQDNAAMDGFAFSVATITPDAPVKVIDFLPAGKVFTGQVPAGCAVRIMTGAALPPGCDTVAPFEHVASTADQIVLRTLPEPGRDVRRRGEEFQAGERLLSPGTLLHSGEIGLLAAAGIEQVLVHPTPRVALLVTGDELVELGQNPPPGSIINSNLYQLRARLQEEDFPVIELGTVGDEPDRLADRLTAGFTADLVLTTGGVSSGDHDYVRSLCDRLGMKVLFWKLNIKPGKPVLFATRDGIPFFGLPGNPAAAAATFEIFVRPALRRLAGHPSPRPPGVHATLAGPVGNQGKREHFLWGTVTPDEQGLLFTPSQRQESGQNRTMQGFNAILPVPPGQAWDGGTPVRVMLVRMPR